MYGWLYYLQRGTERRAAEHRFHPQYQRRQRERAAQILTSEQLEVFIQRQKNLLEMARGAWETLTPPAGFAQD